MSIWLVRHGETDWNVAPQRFMGSVDIPLNERGREQARALATEVEGVAAVWSSPLARALETAQIVAAVHDLDVTIDERLAESRRGAWEGRPIADIQRSEPGAWAAWRAGGAGFRFPGGESLGEHAERTAAALERVAGGPLPALVVCHGGTIRRVLAKRRPHELTGLAVPNASMIRVDD